MAITVFGCIGIGSLVALLLVFFVKLSDDDKEDTKRSIKRGVVEFVAGITLMVGAISIILFTIMLGQFKKATYEDIVSKQYENCINSAYDDGDHLTKQQCDFFQEIMEGKYSTDNELENYLDL